MRCPFCGEEITVTWERDHEPYTSEWHAMAEHVASHSGYNGRCPCGKEFASNQLPYGGCNLMQHILDNGGIEHLIPYSTMNALKKL